jgi:putative acetyltransferase
MIKTKVFKGKKIKIRELSGKDIKRLKEFLDYINSLIEEDAKILLNKKVTLKEEKVWLKNNIELVKKKKQIMCIAEDKENGGKIVGISAIKMKKARENHVGELAISVRKEYRGMGIGKYLMKTTLGLAKKKLRPKIIELAVFENNEIAQNLYKKFGFKKVAKIPKQIQYKGKLIDKLIMILEN